MPQRPLWRAEPGPALVAEVGSVRLVVRNIGGHARFLVLRPVRAAEPCSQALVASGTEADVGRAMTAAERALKRFGPSSAMSSGAP